MFGDIRKSWVLPGLDTGLTPGIAINAYGALYVTNPKNGTQGVYELVDDNWALTRTITDSYTTWNNAGWMPNGNLLASLLSRVVIRDLTTLGSSASEIVSFSTTGVGNANQANVFADYCVEGLTATWDLLRWMPTAGGSWWQEARRITVTPTPQDRCAMSNGMGYDGKHFFCVTQSNNPGVALLKIDRATATIVQSVPAPANDAFSGLTVANGRLYLFAAGATDRLFEVSLS